MPIWQCYLRSRIFPIASNIVNMPDIYKECLKAWYLIGFVDTTLPHIRQLVLNTPIFLNGKLTLSENVELFNTEFNQSYKYKRHKRF